MAPAASFRVAVLDGLTPRTRRWLEQMSPGAARAAQRGAARGRALLRQSYSQAVRRRTGRSRRGIKARVERTVAGLRVTFWPSMGIAAAHELGASIPPALIRPVRARVLRWQAGTEVRFAQFVRRPGFSLPRRPWLSSQVPAIERLMREFLEAEMGRVFEIPGFTGGAGAGSVA